MEIMVSYVPNYNGEHALKSGWAIQGEICREVVPVPGTGAVILSGCRSRDGGDVLLPEHAQIVAVKIVP